MMELGAFPDELRKQALRAEEVQIIRWWSDFCKRKVNTNL